MLIIALLARRLYGLGVKFIFCSQKSVFQPLADFFEMTGVRRERGRYPKAENLLGVKTTSIPKEWQMKKPDPLCRSIYHFLSAITILVQEALSGAVQGRDPTATGTFQRRREEGVGLNHQPRRGCLGVIPCHFKEWG